MVSSVGPLRRERPQGADRLRGWLEARHEPSDRRCRACLRRGRVQCRGHFRHRASGTVRCGVPPRHPDLPQARPVVARRQRRGRAERQAERSDPARSLPAVHRGVVQRLPADPGGNPRRGLDHGRRRPRTRWRDPTHADRGLGISLVRPAVRGPPSRADRGLGRAGAALGPAAQDAECGEEGRDPLCLGHRQGAHHRRRPERAAQHDALS